MNTEIIHNITLVGIDVYTLFVFHHSRIIFNNNLLYTGISRASQETTQIGDLSTVENCIAIDGNENRQTQLKDFLLKSYELKTSQKEIMNNEETEDDTF